MTLECRNKHYHKVSQLFNQVVKTYNKKLSLGSYCECTEAKMIAYTWMRNILSCYVPYTSELTYLYSLEIVRENSLSVTITLDIGSDQFVYTGTGSAIEILQSLEIDINQSTSPAILATLLNGILYIYSYDTSLNFSTTTTITSSLLTTSATLENLENSPNTLIDLWNCLTADELCELLTKTYKLDPTC